DEPEEWKFDKPMVILQSGDRMNIQLPEKPLDVVTRYGSLKLSPSSISSISLMGEEHGVHQIVLNNGSKFAGLVARDELSLKLVSTEMTITLPLSTIARLQLSADAPDVPDDSSTLALASGDLLVGSLGGDLKLDTMFDSIKLPASQIRAIARVKDTNS